MKRARLNPRPGGMRGLAAVELALVTPLFVFLLLATADLGRALYQYNSLNKMVRNGAEFMARNALTGSSVIDLGSTANQANIQTTQNLVVYGKPAASKNDTALLPKLKTDDVTVTSADLGLGRSTVTVTATFTLQGMIGIASGLITFLPTTMTASATLVAL